jgi:hypothetical protein
VWPGGLPRSLIDVRKRIVKIRNRPLERTSLLSMETATGRQQAGALPAPAVRPGEIVYLLIEVRAGARGLVHEIGSRARVVHAGAAEITLEIDAGAESEVVSCSTEHVRRGARCRRAYSERWQTASMLLPSGS